MSQLGYTPGNGAQIKTDQGSSTGDHMQVIKLGEGIAGSENLIPGTVARGVLVEVSQIDAPVSISGTVPVSIAATVPVSLQGTATVSGTVAISGTPAVSGTVTVNQGTPAANANAWPVQISDGTHDAHLTSVGGNYAQDVNITASLTLPVQVQPVTQNFWRATISFSASQSAQLVYSPPSGKTVYVMGFILTPTAAGAQFILYDNSDSATSELYNGQPPLGSFVVTFPVPVPLIAVNNVLRYSTGASAAGTLVAWGYAA